MDFARPTKSGTTIPGKTTISLRGKTAYCSEVGVGIVITNPFCCLKIASNGLKIKQDINNRLKYLSSVALEICLVYTHVIACIPN
jgi:hypothetical protein